MFPAPNEQRRVIIELAVPGLHYGRVVQAAQEEPYMQPLLDEDVRDVDARLQSAWPHCCARHGPDTPAAHTVLNMYGSKLVDAAKQRAAETRVVLFLPSGIPVLVFPSGRVRMQSTGVVRTDNANAAWVGAFLRQHGAAASRPAEWKSVVYVDVTDFARGDTFRVPPGVQLCSTSRGTIYACSDMSANDIITTVASSNTCIE